DPDEAALEAGHLQVKQDDTDHGNGAQAPDFWTEATGHGVRRTRDRDGICREAVADSRSEFQWRRPQNRRVSGHAAAFERRTHSSRLMRSKRSGDASVNTEPGPHRPRGSPFQG